VVDPKPDPQEGPVLEVDTEDDLHLVFAFDDDSGLRWRKYFGLGADALTEVSADRSEDCPDRLPY
jgi:hypothetical protein